MEKWQLDRVAQLIKLARYLITRADNRGRTHGEKHYMMQTALDIMAQAEFDLKRRDGGGIEDTRQYEPDMSDIPF